MIHLDTNFLIALLIGGTAEDRRITNLLNAGEQLGISAIAWAEFPVTQDQLNDAVILLPPPEPLVAETANLAAELYNTSGRRRNSLADCLIAASAIRSNAALATNDMHDFRPFEPLGLTIVSPS